MQDSSEIAVTTSLRLKGVRAKGLPIVRVGERRLARRRLGRLITCFTEGRRLFRPRISAGRFCRGVVSHVRGQGRSCARSSLVKSSGCRGLVGRTCSLTSRGIRSGRIVSIGFRVRGASPTVSRVLRGRFKVRARAGRRRSCFSTSINTSKGSLVDTRECGRGLRGRDSFR